MTFKEYWKEEEKKEANREDIERDKQALLKILRSEGFSDQQINEIRMDKAWKICEPVLWKKIETQTRILERSMAKVLKNSTAAFGSLWKDPEKRELLVADKGLRKDLFNFAGAMDDIERGLFKIDEMARQFLEELKKKCEEKRKEEDS